jgi:hypothetical protein
MEFQPTTIESNERRWANAFAVLLLVLSLIFFPILWPLYFVRRYYSLRFRGFWVTREGRDAIEYQELHNGKVERLTIDGEMMVGAPHVVYVPTAEEWQRTMPGWAQGRREEIIENVKRKLGTKNYEYDYS